MAGEEEVGKTLIVGMKMDARGRELLTWSLVKVAGAGDRVIAMHVLPAVLADADWNPSSLISLIKHFESVLAVYEGFCNLKQIELKMKLCRGSSIRKTLVREASSVSASKLILGATKSSNIIGSSSVSIAKYCAKKLSRGCLVLAVNNGKIIYEKDAAGSKLTHELLQKCDSIKLDDMSSESTSPSISCQLTESGEISSFDIKDGNSSKTTSTFDDSLGNDESRVDEIKDHTSSESEEMALDVDPVNEHESSVGCSSMATQESADRRPGWLLLRRTVLNQKMILSHVKSKASVVKWVMRLPSRYYSSSMVHTDHRRVKSDVSVKSGFDEEVDVMAPLSPATVFEELPKELLSLLQNYSSVCRLFSYKELLQATSNFNLANIIGKGGTCKVYKGSLTDGKELAFKALRCSDNLMDDFISEIEIITNLHHRNILSLYGFCVENHHLVLVYDFLSRGSLDDNLHGIKGDKIDLISWADRFKIAIGVAEGLDYLHNDSSREPVIHRDIKSSNILLSDDFEPQISDFGLAQWSSSSRQSSKNTDCSDLAGTFGYLAPEYFMYGKVDAKIDIYAFGVVLLELLSGRKPVCTSRPKGEESLVMWAKPILLVENFDQVVDPSLGNNYNIDEMERMCLAASLCISQASHSRPSAALVLKLLKGETEVIEWARSELRASMASEESDDESVLLHSNIQSHINLALLDMEEDDELSTSSTDQSANFLTSNSSLEDYLKARCGRSSSF
ncbi:probable serine/threonine-protein kinase PBL5 [Dendrobium catenatum]|uniref:Proline-rich receptor-like protein kinase PERK8 n=1 Tax=Dendrobium catenatum TaxID=906689 RepID=A0A2I0X257_9ASPA|nr:probable serine/threonine-protein kinase PBL5 [Dendrobium catenatum]PKU81993.1 Proline-rich receptor-like protein kinase PERK8 [Dendrobium catenatum]